MSATATGAGRGVVLDMMKMIKSKAPATGGNRRIPQKFVRQPGAPYQRQLSNQERAIKFAKDLLAQGHHTQHRIGLEKVCSGLAGSGPSNIAVHFTPSLFSSASLLASYIKNKLIRNQESITSLTIRKILNLAEQKNPLWNHSTSQLSRKIQFTESMERLALKREALELKSSFDPDNSELRSKLIDLDSTIRKTQVLIDNIEPVVYGNLHPDSLLSADKVALTPTEAANLPSPSGTVRGILIRIKGPRKGNRAIKQQKSCGRVSINSVDYVVHEECNIQIPSKLGIYGLYVRIVYSKAERLITPKTKLPVLNVPSFNFKSIRN